MPIQIHSHQLNRKTVTGILITWKSGMITCIQKTADTMDMLVYEFDDIEEVTFIDMVVYDDQPAIDTKTEGDSPTTNAITDPISGFRFVETDHKTIEKFVEYVTFKKSAQIGDCVHIDGISYICKSINPVVFVPFSRTGGDQW